MRKLLVAIACLLIVAAAIVVFYMSFDRKAVAPSIALKAIPQTAAMIFETEQAGEIWRDISQSNLIWQELQATDYFFQLDQAGKLLDSLLRKQADLRGYIANKPMAISVHISGARDYDFLMSLQLEIDAKEDQIPSAVAALLKSEKKLQTRTYDGVKIFSFTLPFSESTLHYFLNDNLLVMSLSGILAEESVRAFQQNASVAVDKSFQAVRNTKGYGSRAQLYINYKQLKTILAQYASPAYTNKAFFTQPYAQWSALDISLAANAINANGFVLCKDSSDGWVGSFRNSEPTELEVLNYMPSNTAYFAFFGFDDFKSFRKEQFKTLQKANRLYQLKEKQQKYDESCQCDMQDLALSWIGTQAAAFITEPLSETYEQNFYAVIKAKDVKQAAEKLGVLEASNSKGEEEMQGAEIFRDVEIHRAYLGQYYGDVLLEAFDGLNDPYYAIIDDMVIMANSSNALRSVINSIRTNNSLFDDQAFQTIENQISDRANFVLFSSLARSPQIYSNILEEGAASNLLERTEVLRKFQAFVYDVSYYKKDLYYNNVYFRHNPDYKQETNSLWESRLDAPLVGSPHFVQNHYTNALEILVQDAENRLYLLSNSGKPIWQIQIDGPINSRIFQVDAYRNDKLQMAFSTSNSIYLIDRNGNNVESFPLKLPAKASAGLSVVDYEKNRDYRFFIPIETRDILAFDINGKRVKGWEFKDPHGKIVSEIEHLQVRGKDYLFAYNSRGDIHLLDRKGMTREKTTQKMENVATGNTRVQLNGDILSSALYYMDTSGFAIRQTFNGIREKFKPVDQKILDCDFVDLNGDDILDYVFLSELGISAYTFSGDEIFTSQLEDIENGKIRVFSTPTGGTRLAVFGIDDARIYMMDGQGKAIEGFPLYGTGPLALGDMDGDGYLNLITLGGQEYIYAYSIE